MWTPYLLLRDTLLAKRIYFHDVKLIDIVNLLKVQIRADDSFRLPRLSANVPIIEPSRYDVELSFAGLRDEDRNNNGDFMYVGNVRISAYFNGNSEWIVLHCDFKGQVYPNLGFLDKQLYSKVCTFFRTKF